MPALIEHLLLCHPSSPCHSIRAISARATTMTDGGLALRYRLIGPLSGIQLPPPQAPGSTNGLWQHTCLEAFVAAVDGPAYDEFNFSPSGQWAHYRFTDYRQRDDDFLPAGAPQISCQRHPDGLILEASLGPELLPRGSFTLGLTAVIEALDGSKNYWALTHCAAQPNFHLRQSFSLAFDAPPP